MVKPSTKRALVAVVIGLLVGYVLVRRSCGKEHLMTPQERELKAAQQEWDSYVRVGFDEVNATSNPAVKASLERLDRAKAAAAPAPAPARAPAPAPEPTPALDTTTIVLIVVGSLAGLGLLIGLGVWGYHKFTAPTPYYAPPAYGARRR